MKAKKKKKNGFSLLEVMIAGFIVSLGLVGALTLINYSIKAASFSKNKLIASFLAQEGIEIVRHIRDSQSSWDDWYSCPPLPCLSESSYLVEYYDDSIIDDFSPYSETPLRIDSSGRYQYASGATTLFSRKVTLKAIISPPETTEPNELQVVVEVKWKERGVEKKVTAEDRLWNWR